ncbi:NTP transferase domain-containing protein [Candidatus Bathyarchaeota archaeon]|nr:NTP transferase domain-containing protein [Candidatus Bathyarchaeota archaeon]
MRVAILAAGEGVRLRPLTEHRPKHAIPVAGRPIIHHLIEAFRQNGVRRFTVVVGYLREVIESYLLDGGNLGVKIDYVHQREAKGTADAAAQLQDRIDEPRFILCYGDIYISLTAAARVVKAFDEESVQAALAVVKAKDQERYGLVTVEDGYVKGIVEKPRRPPSNSFANAGMYIFERSIFKGIKSTSRSPRGEFELTGSIAKLLESGIRIKSITINQEDWIDIGRPWDLLEANERALQTLRSSISGDVESGAVLIGPVIVRPGVRILSGTRIEGPVYIGEESVVGPNCYIRKYTSIGKNVRVGNGCEIKNCIVMDHTKIPHQSYLGDSIIGERCNLGAGTMTGNLRLDGKSVRMKIRNKTVDSGRRKLGAIVGDGVSTGVNVNLMPGVKIGSGTLIGPGITVYGDLKSNLKILVRQRAVIKKVMPDRIPGGRELGRDGIGRVQKEVPEPLA